MNRVTGDKVSRRVPVASRKLQPPPAPHRRVAREPLAERLSHAPASRLVLLQAPAGFGKTTAMAIYREHLASEGWPTAWLTLDAADNELARLLPGLVSVLHQLCGEATASAGDASLQEVEDLLARIPGRVALFIDEAEHVQDAAVLGVLRSLVERLPETSVLVIASRTVPDLALSRLRVRGQLLEIDSEHLRFSREETRRFLVGSGIGLQPGDADLLHDKTTGWVAALRLSALALERTSDPSEWIAQFSGSHETLAGFLAEEVLRHQPALLREFLLRTSILQALEPALCATLVPQADTGTLLEGLLRASLFTTPPATAGGPLRYHALFADFLRGRLSRELPGEVPSLHLRAARWYLEQGRPVPAINHTLAAGDHAAAVALLEVHAMPLLMQGRMKLLVRWLAQVPEAELQRRAQLCLVQAWALCFTSGPEQALVRLQASGLADHTDPAIQTHAQALRLTLLSNSDRVAEAYDEGVNLLARRRSAGDFAEAVLANVVAHVATVSAQGSEARTLLDIARRLQPADSAFGFMYAETTDGLVDFLEGRLRQAAARFRLALGRTREHRPAGVEGNAWPGLLHAATLYETNDTVQAERLLHVYLPMASDVGLPDHVIMGHVMLARLASLRGDTAAAVEQLAQLEAVGHRRALPRVVAAARLERARRDMLAGRYATAALEMERAGDSALWAQVDQLAQPANDLENATLSRLRMQVLTGGCAGAIGPLEHQIARATAASRERRLLLLRSLLAMAQARTEGVDAALKTLLPALRMGAREGFVRLFVDEGPQLGALVHEAAHRMRASAQDPVFVDYLVRLAQAFGEVAALPAQSPTTAAEPLTKQEVRVLAEVAKGLSNDEVATILGITRSTVRTHMRNVSAKLGACNRTQAVALARSSGALD